MDGTLTEKKKDELTFNVLIEDTVNTVGGCGRYQWGLSFLIHFAKTCVCWSMIQMTFNGQQPDFVCQSTDNSTTYEGTCDPDNYKCDTRVYSDEMNTIVNEFDLVCENKWSVAMITTIQMSGVLVGCFFAGMLGDLIGRKPTYLLSLVIVIVFNVVAIFSVSWEMYAGMRFGIGLGVGFFLDIQYNLMTEFMPTIWRPRAIAIPGWGIEAGFFALVVWLLKDWKYVHIATAVSGIPFLFSACFVQESSRWLITKQRFRKAEMSIRKIAKINGFDAPDVSKIVEQAKVELEKEKTSRTKVTLIDLFRTASRARTTFSLIVIWFSISYSYYGLLFAIETLSGDLYLNILLINVMEVLVNLIMPICVNRFGRKASCFGFFFITSVFGLIVGVIQYVDTPAQGVITNVFAYSCRMMIGVCWACMTVYTTELYPTTVRNTAYGLHNTVAGVGDMVAPQIVYLNDKIDGLLYFVAAALMFISALLWCQFPETKGLPLIDTYGEENNTPHVSVKRKKGISNSAFDDEDTPVGKMDKESKPSGTDSTHVSQTTSC